MLVVVAEPSAGDSIWRYVLWGSLLLAVMAVLSLAPYLTASTNIVKLRNALLLSDRHDVDFNWTPDRVPEDFKLESGPVDPFFLKVADQLGLAAMPDDWSRATAIVRHLLGSNSKTLRGGAVQSDLRRTYLRITVDGEGYCSDFVHTFMAIAIASGIQVRAWAFSFDGFGGHGHIWPEIWNRQLGRWQLVGVFNNYYFYETAGEPLSAMEIRRAMLSGSKLLRMASIDPTSRPGWKIEEKAWEYYRRGLDEWYMWWGNNVFTYERSSLVSMFAGISRSLEQFGGIVQGVSPRLQILVTPENQRQVKAIEQLRLHLRIVGAALAVSFLLMLASLSRSFWRRRKVRGSR